MFQIDGTLIVVFFTFLVFVVLMKGVFFDPVMRIKLQREDAIETSRQTAVTASDKRLQSEAEVHRRLSEAHHTAQLAIAQRRDAAQKQALAQVQNARDQAQQLLDRQFAQLREENAQVYNTLEANRSELAQEIVNKLVARHASATY